MDTGFIETIIDGMDPYQIIRDMDFRIYKVKEGEKETSSETYYIQPKGSEQIQVLNSGFVGTDLIKKFRNTKNKISDIFIAGSGIDLLAYYAGGLFEGFDYNKAFKLYFEYYGAYIKKKLLHEPVYIEQLIKSRFIRRKNILTAIVGALFSSMPPNLIACRNWFDKHNVSDASGVCFCASSDWIRALLLFISLNDSVEPFDEERINNSSDKYDIKSAYNGFIDDILLKESNQWIVVPYFANHYTINSFKFINPKDNRVYTLKLKDFILSYAGLYPFGINLTKNSEIIRIVDNSVDFLTLTGYKRRMRYDHLNYLAVDIDNNASKHSNLYFENRLFLFKPNSSYQLVKQLASANGDTDNSLRICNFDNYKESNETFDYLSFIEKEFKTTIIEEYGKLGLKTQAFLNVIDFKNPTFKNRILNWLSKNKYTSVLDKINSIIEESVKFKSYTIISTANGYLRRSSKNGEEEDILTNFVIHIDENIIFNEIDDMLHKGRMILNGEEYPIAFYKSELLKKKDAIETAAIKAFTSYNHDEFSLMNNGVGKAAPMVFDKTYNNALVYVLNRGIGRAPYHYGALNLGWNKSGGIFNSLSWSANRLNVIKRPQTIYALTKGEIPTGLLNVFSTLSIPDKPITNTNLETKYKFLNIYIKQLLSMLLAYLYRTYYNYEVKPIKVFDSIHARNTLKYIFAALGQTNPYTLADNDRLVKSEKILLGLNDYPIYIRSELDVDKFISYHPDKPYLIFSEKLEEDDTFFVNCGCMYDQYPLITQFAFQTFTRFFKWLFNVNVEEFSLENKNIVNGLDQLISEGDKIFNMIWWDEVITASNKEVQYSALLKVLIANMTYEEAIKAFNYSPSMERIVIRRYMIPKGVAREYGAKVYRSLKKHNLCFESGTHIYTYVDTETIKTVFLDALTKDKKQLRVDELDIYLTDEEMKDISLPTSFNKIKRSISTEEWKENTVVKNA